jgi:tetratricopeptide (TPR) repeat protein
MIKGKMARLVKKLMYIIGIMLCCNALYAQSLDQAKKLYNDGKYEEAKPAFEKLVQQAPNNASYNHWYGVCCYETGDFGNAEKYLAIAVKRRVQESYRYLAELYIQAYRFDEATGMYKEYIDLLTKKKQDIEPYKLRLELAEKASRMVDKVEDIQIIDSVVVGKHDFLPAYILSEESGTLSTYKDFFQTGEPIVSTVYMNQKKDKIFYAHNTDENRYCLFTQSKLMDKWGDEKQLPMNINSSDDENYPFVLSDGVTMYYASKKNGSIGGYDLFVTRYNINSDTYLTPEQLGMPYNSLANDYMIVFDEVKGLGWFVSDRNQPEGKVCVYLFIPNEARSRVDSDDMDIKRARAAIASIRDSWKPDADYLELIKLAHLDMPSGKEENKKDFEFVVNNSLVYYTLDAFKSPEAKNYYEKVISLNRQIGELDHRLDELRTSYREGGQAQREQIGSTILQAENLLNDLLFQPDEWEKKARNAEINYLKNTN